MTDYAKFNARIPSKRLANVMTAKSSPSKPALTLKNYPCIIQDPEQTDRWLELRCYICKGNAREDGLFLKGLKGLKRHMQLSHKPHFADLPLKQQFSLQEATIRTFTLAQLNDMINGKIDRVQMITCAKEVSDCNSSTDEDIVTPSAKPSTPWKPPKRRRVQIDDFDSETDTLLGDYKSARYGR
jgi:hypothetical protein